ncbi:MAG: hypothetical protein EA383_03255 [Spirochaetaceae bacterium]|nr:MAG: hypothetical protein EA383_03255 [Spirochaetaceae bacterium]
MDVDSKSDYHNSMNTYGSAFSVFTRKALLCLLLAALAIPLAALDVAEDELRRVEGADIQFVNFEGPVESPQSLAEITGIGEYLAEHGSYFGRYRLIRAADPSVPAGLDADILYILPEARVNHINNLRAILAGYVVTRYGYTSATASLIARLTTIYNAVNRQDLDFFEDRYKPVVLQNLSAEGVGISLLYSEWAGNTELVLPLRSDRDIVDPFALADERVIEDLRARQDMGIEDRRQLVDLMDEVIIRDAEEISEEQERIAGELQDLEERERELLEQEERLRAEREDIAELPEEERAEREAELAEQEAELAEQREAIDAERDDVTAEQETLEERDRELAEREEQAQAVRDGVAEDQQQMMADEEVTIAAVPDDEIPEEDALVVEPRTVVGLQVHEERDEGSRSRIVRIDAGTGEITETADVDRILSRSLVPFGPENEFVLLRESSDGSARLSLVESNTLSEVHVSGDQMFPGTALVFAEDHVYAVARIDGSYRLARYDRGLERVSHSDVTVVPAAIPLIDGDRIIIQTGMESFVVVAADTLVQPGNGD